MQKLIERAGLPVQGPAFGFDRYMALMRVDKKAQSGDIRFVVIEALGRARVQKAPEALVAKAIDTHCVAA